MYLVVLNDRVRETARGIETLSFTPAIVSIPARNTEGHITYDVVVKPKFNATTKPRPRDYRVVKHWSDRGAEQQRPASITVDLFKNGVRAETVTLNAANNWSYAWSDESGAEWTAVEQLDGLAYTVTNTREGATFIITNTHPHAEEDAAAPHRLQRQQLLAERRPSWRSRHHHARPERTAPSASTHRMEGSAQ